MLEYLYWNCFSLDKLWFIPRTGLPWCDPPLPEAPEAFAGGLQDPGRHSGVHQRSLPTPEAAYGAAGAQ